MAHPEAFLADTSARHDDNTTPRAKTAATNRTSKSSIKKRNREETPTSAADEVELGTITGETEGGDLKELQTLYELWKAAGRNVNLWDWLQGFEGTMIPAKPGDESAEQSTARDSPTKRTKRASSADDAAAALKGDDSGQDSTLSKEIDPELQDKLHATFIRFCEEARMLGLVRARGGRTAKRSDEVVKGIALV